MRRDLDILVALDVFERLFERERTGVQRLAEDGRVHAEIGEGKTGAAMMAIRTGVPILPVYIDPERKAFRRTRVYIGEPYLPFPEKRRANAEDYEVVTEEIMNRIRAVRDHRAEMEAAE